MRHSLTLALAASLIAGGLSAQTATDSTAPDSTPHKHGGLFGKAKSFVGNKTVKAVAKTVACTMVPGGQVIANAMDAASSRSAEGAVASAAGAAGGSGCMPGGLGGPAMAAKGISGAGMGGGIGGVAGSLAGASELAAMTKMGGGRGMPMMAATPTMAAAGYGGAPGALGDEEVAKCLSLTPAEYRDFADPTHGAPRQPTKKEIDRQAKLSQKIDVQHYQSCMMAQQAAAMQAGSAAAPTDEPAAEPPAAIAISADPVGELRKGRTTLRGIGWAPGAAELSDGAGGAFGEAMARMALAVRQAGGSYRVDIYLEPQVDKASAGRIGAARLATVQDALDHAGLPAGLVTPGKTKTDKNDRLEFVRAKK
jgi:hypothetical protein